MQANLDLTVRQIPKKANNIVPDNGLEPEWVT